MVPTYFFFVTGAAPAKCSACSAAHRAVGLKAPVSARLPAKRAAVVTDTDCPNARTASRIVDWPQRRGPAPGLASRSHLQRREPSWLTLTHSRAETTRTPRIR